MERRALTAFTRALAVRGDALDSYGRCLA
jgi:hypothetical protein